MVAKTVGAMVVHLVVKTVDAKVAKTVDAKVAKTVV
jgi:hypothetical protein